MYWSDYFHNMRNKLLFCYIVRAINKLTESLNLSFSLNIDLLVSW